MEPPSQSASKSPSSEPATDNYPKVISKAGCAHEWRLAYVDAEGIYNYQCEHCVMGIRSRDKLPSDEYKP